jgi:ATP-dependent protease Clp ATPase subunit
MSDILNDYKKVSSTLTEVEREKFINSLSEINLQEFNISEITNIVRFIDDIDDVNKMVEVIAIITENNSGENLQFVLKFFEGDLNKIANIHNN